MKEMAGHAWVDNYHCGDVDGNLHDKPERVEISITVG